MVTLERLKNLRRLYLRNTPITDEGLKHLSGLTALEELDLYGTSLTDRGIAFLRNLTAIRKLNLLGAEVTDAGAEMLARLSHLRELNLYRSHVSNAGPGQARGTEGTRVFGYPLQPRYRSGCGRLQGRAARVNRRVCRRAMAGSSKAPAVLPAGKGDRAIADWVRRLKEKPNFALILWWQLPWLPRRSQTRNFPT